MYSTSNSKTAKILLPAALTGVFLIALALFLKEGNQHSLPIPNLDGTSTEFIPNSSLTANSLWEQNNAYYHFIDEPSDIEDILWTDRKGEIDSDGKKHFLFIDVGPAFGITEPTHPYNLIFGKKHFDPCFGNADRVDNSWLYIYEGDETPGNLHTENYAISPCASWAGLFPQYTSTINDMPLVEPGDRIHLFLDPQEHQKFTDRSATPRIAYTPPPSGPQCNDGIDNDDDEGIDVPGSFVVTQVEGESVISGKSCSVAFACFDNYIGKGIALFNKKMYAVSYRKARATTSSIQKKSIWLSAYDFETGTITNPYELPNDLDQVDHPGFYMTSGTIVDRERKILYVPYSMNPNILQCSECGTMATARIHKVDVSGDSPSVLGTYTLDTAGTFIVWNWTDMNHSVYENRMQLSEDGNYLYAFLKDLGTGIDLVKIDTATMNEVNRVHVGVASWSSYHINVRSGVAFVVHNSNKMTKIDLESFSIIVTEDIVPTRDSVTIIDYLPKNNTIFLFTQGFGAASDHSSLLLLDANTLQQKDQVILGNGSRQGEYDIFTPAGYVDDVRERAFVTITPSNGGSTGESYPLSYDLSNGTLQQITEEEAQPKGITFLVPQRNVGALKTDEGIGVVNPATGEIIAYKTYEELIGADERNVQWLFDGSDPVLGVSRPIIGTQNYEHDPPYRINLGDSQCTSPEGSES